MLEAIPFLLLVIFGVCSILFRKRITQSVVRWQQKVFDTTVGARGIKFLERGYLIGGAFVLVLSLLHLLGILK